MKIVENNYKPVIKVPLSIICPGCESKIEYEKSDLTKEFWREEGWTHSPIKYRGFDCPACKRELGIETIYS